MFKCVAAVALALGLFPQTGLAQTPSTSSTNDLSAGIKVGFNVSGMVEDGEHLDSKTGIVIGGFVRKSLKDGFFFQPEFLLSKEGAAFENLSLNLTYLRFPLLAGISFPGRGATPFVVAGPSIGINTSAYFKEEGNDDTEDIEIAGGDFGLLRGVNYYCRSATTISAGDGAANERRPPPGVARLGSSAGWWPIVPSASMRRRRVGATSVNS